MLSVGCKVIRAALCTNSCLLAVVAMMVQEPERNEDSPQN